IGDLVGRLPDPREVHHGRCPTRNDVWRLPNRHRLVNLASIEIDTDGALEIVDESKYLVVRRRPIVGAGFIRDIAIQRRRHKVDQFGHRAETPSRAKIGYRICLERARAPSLTFSVHSFGSTICSFGATT